jgi:hypothetical protein
MPIGHNHNEGGKIKKIEFSPSKFQKIPEILLLLSPFSWSRKNLERDIYAPFKGRYKLIRDLIVAVSAQIATYARLKQTPASSLPHTHASQNAPALIRTAHL